MIQPNTRVSQKPSNITLKYKSTEKKFMRWFFIFQTQRVKTHCDGTKMYAHFIQSRLLTFPELKKKLSSRKISRMAWLIVMKFTGYHIQDIDFLENGSNNFFSNLYNLSSRQYLKYLFLQNYWQTCLKMLHPCVVYMKLSITNALGLLDIVKHSVWPSSSSFWRPPDLMQLFSVVLW